MQRYLVTGLVVAAIMATATPSTAGEYGMIAAAQRFARNFWFGYRQNQLWPEPYVEPDRQAARMPMEMMIANGWRRENTLNDHHFEEGSTELTEAGRLKVKMILTNVPPQYRSIFVESSLDPQATSARIASIEQVASNYVIDGEMPTVIQTQHGAVGWPANDIDMMRRKYLESAPEPRIPSGLISAGNF